MLLQRVEGRVRFGGGRRAEEGDRAARVKRGIDVRVLGKCVHGGRGGFGVEVLGRLLLVTIHNFERFELFDSAGLPGLILLLLELLLFGLHEPVFAFTAQVVGPAAAILDINVNQSGLPPYLIELPHG